MRLPGFSLAFLLALLLVSTTPVGTGTGLHELDLLHPLFNHVHLVNGRILTHAQLAASGVPVPAAPTNGPALGAGGGGAPIDGGLDVSPVGLLELTLILPGTLTESVVEDTPSVHGREEAPPDPPPVS